ncbi:MAG: glycosyltransferase family 4 protein, partial [Chitinophagales bacterium]
YSSAKLIYRSHNIESEIWENIAANTSNPLKRLFLKMQSRKLIAYEKQIVNFAEAIVPISISDAGYYKTFFTENKIKYSPTGIDINTIDLKEQDPAEVKDIYFLGGLDWLPNIEGLHWFIKNVFPQIRALYPEIKFHIAGRNAGNDLKQMNEPGVVFHGEVDDALQFILDKLLCVVPLLSGSGMKLKIIEAMAAAKPVVTSPKGAQGMPPGIDEFIEIVHTPLHWIDAIGRIILDKEAALKKANRSKQFVLSTLDNNKLSAALIEFYESL